MTIYFQQDWIPHQNYSILKKRNDIGLILLAKKIDFTSNVSPVCLKINEGDERSNVPLILTGWGKTSAETGKFYFYFIFVAMKSN